MSSCWDSRPLVNWEWSGVGCRAESSADDPLDCADWPELDKQHEGPDDYNEQED